MDDKTMHEYIEACNNAKSHLEAPLLGQILTPICTACFNVDMHYGSWDEPECKIYGVIPKEYIGAQSKNCPHFIKNPNSKSIPRTREDII